jgi:hypothetical protein
MPTIKKGACLCGNVSFTVTGDLKSPVACHCVQCRKQSGHYFAATNVVRNTLAIVGEENVSWYRSSATARRGFCSTCGSFLFWDAVGSDLLSVAMGAFDGPTGTHLEAHIFVAEKGDYYAIADERPQHMDAR